MVKAIVGALVGGIVVFMWGFVSHIMLPLGEMGIRQVPGEAAVVAAMQSGIREPGVYLIPGRDMSRKPTAEEQTALEARYEAGPNAFLVYRPTGAAALSPQQLGTEFFTNAACALIASVLLLMSRVGYLGRVAAVTLLGLFTALAANIPYWNWYRFPADFTGAEMLHHLVGWFIAGLVLAAFVRPKPAGAHA